MTAIGEALQRAVRCHQAGDLRTAEQIYRQVLTAQPQQADALHLLGVIARQRGDCPLAADYIARAIEQDGSQPAFHNNLGEALRAMGKASEAAACYRRALELDPAYVEARRNLGLALIDQRQLAEAAECLRRVLERRPTDAATHNNLGRALHLQGGLDEAVACYQRAIELRPEYPLAWNNLGSARKEQQHLEEAAACYRRALALEPASAEVHANLADVLLAQGEAKDALACCRRALRVKPDCALAHHNLGNVWRDQGRLDGAEASYRRALELEPNSCETWNSLGLVLHERRQYAEASACYHQALRVKPDDSRTQLNLGSLSAAQGQITEAIGWYRRVLEIRPDWAEAWNSLASAMRDQGDIDESIGGHRRALELKPDFAAAHSNLLFALQYRPGITSAGLAEAHAEFQRGHAAALQSSWRAHENVRDLDRPLRLGFVSPDFGYHPVGSFLIRVIENLGQYPVETFCYSDRLLHDGLTARFQAVASVWRETSGARDERLAGQIRDDRIDILFDLAGHTGHNRLLVFARKPAPIQATWIGYEGTTGLAAMDYLIADRHVAPPGAESSFRERVLRLPEAYVCFDAPADAPPVAPLPALGTGRATFGCFNNPAKIAPPVVAVWSEILRRLPDARLILKYRAWLDPVVRRRYVEMFAGHGIEPGRVEWQSFAAYGDYLAAYGEVDLALDPFPFSGSATTCEALWMGVPVITCPGDTFASRHSLSHLSNVGLSETIASSMNQYVELATSLAADLPRLAALRAGLRGRMAASPLCDGPRLAANLVALLRGAWYQWVRQRGD